MASLSDRISCFLAITVPSRFPARLSSTLAAGLKWETYFRICPRSRTAPVSADVTSAA